MFNLEVFKRALIRCGSSWSEFYGCMHDPAVRKIRDFDELVLYSGRGSDIVDRCFLWRDTCRGHEGWLNIKCAIDEAYDKELSNPLGELPVGRTPRPKGKRYLCA